MAMVCSPTNSILAEETCYFSLWSAWTDIFNTLDVAPNIAQSYKISQYEGIY